VCKKEIEVRSDFAYLTLSRHLKTTEDKMASNRIVICEVCKKEIEVRSDFAYLTLSRHLKEHK